METKSEMKIKSSLPLMMLHLFVLCAIVIAKPLYDIMAQHPEYFVVSRISNLEIYLFVIALVGLIPLFFCIPLVIARAISRDYCMLLQRSFVFAFVALFVMQLANRISGLAAPVSILISLLAASVVTLQYPRNPKLSMCMTLFSPLIILLPTLFLFNEKIGRAHV